MNARSDAFMLRAVELARNGFPAPNPRVGCVIVREGEIVGEGWHDFAGGPHAEAVALAFARERAAGADVYVTLEPCNHVGRTPPCSRALIEARVARVIVAVRDPNPVAAGGIEALTAAGIECEIGLCADLAAEVNDPWLTAVRRQRPYVIAKVAVTSDGFIAKPDGTSKWITGPEARAEGHRLRAEMGCVLVGRRTVEIDDPLLTARIPGVINQPVRVVLDRSAKLAATHQVFNRDAPTIRFVGSGRSALECDVELEQFDVTSVLDALFERGVRGVLVEGGAETLASFLRSGFVDRVERFTAPVVFGEGLEAPVPVGFELVESKMIGADKHEVLKVLGPREQ